MTRRALTAAAVLLTLVAETRADRGTFAQSAFDRVLDVEPAQVHIGDIIDLGGTGYDAHTQEAFVVGCPSPFNTGQGSPHPYLPTGKGQNNWYTDDKGQFAGWTIRAVDALVGPSKPYGPCTIYAKYGPNWEGSTVPGHFYILPGNRRLDPCSRAICFRVKTSLQRVKAGSPIRVSILSGWPGARVVLTIHGGQSTTHKTIQLDWAGNRTFSLPAQPDPPATGQTMKVDISAHATFASRQGNASTHVLVVR